MPSEDMWQLAPEASVALIASQTSESGRAASKTSAGSALSGGLSSAVTANLPARSARSSRLPEDMPGGGSS